MAYLDKRDGIKGLDRTVEPNMLNRTQVVQGTDVSVQELVNALCDILDGEDEGDIRNMTGLDNEACARVNEIRNKLSKFWTYNDGRLVQ